jgi:pSer/pThr/pTyr-binding forkhead associated (FHA) protein
LINIKYNSLYNYYNAQILIEKKKKYPSLKFIVQHIESFEKLYLPLQKYINNSNFKTIFVIKEVYGNFLNFLNNDYPVLLRAYNRINLNPQSIEYSTISRLLKSIEIFDEFKNINFIEWINLSPSLKQIEDKFNFFLTKKFDDESLKYFEYYNEIINAEPSELKINELINFRDYLINQLQINENKEQLCSNINSILTNTKEDLYELIEDFFNKKIMLATNRDELSSGFDFAISYFMKLKDITMINFLQNLKKSYLKKTPKIKNKISFLRKKKDNLNIPQQINLEKHKEVQKKKSLTEDSDNNRYNQLFILDNYTTRNYIIFTKPLITLGRDSQNDIIIKCNWVSGKHLLFNFQNLTFTDLNSTNGTYINNRKINSYNISDDFTFSIAKTFIFELRSFKQFVLIKFIELTDQNLLKDNKIKEIIKTLLNTSFIFLNNNNSFSINTVNGKITSENTHDTILVKYNHPKFMLINSISKLPEKIFQPYEIYNSGRFSFEIR